MLQIFDFLDKNEQFFRNKMYAQFISTLKRLRDPTSVHKNRKAGTLHTHPVAQNK